MEERIRELEEALRALGLRLSRLEGREAAPEPQASPPKMRISVPPETKMAPPKRDSALGMSKLLAVVSVICFVLAATFIVKLAVDSGWLTLERQWGLLVLFGAGLSAAGRYLPFVDKLYRSYLSASGLVVFFIAAYSSSLYFNLCSQDTSLIFGMIATILGLSMFKYHESEIFPIVSVVGTYLSVVLLNHNNMGYYFLTGFFLLWASVFSWFSTHFRSRTVNLVATYHGLGVFTFLTMGETNKENVLLGLVILTLQFVIFTWGVAFYSIKNKVTLTKAETWSYFPALCFYYGIMYFFINVLSPSLAPWIGLGMALSFLLAYESIKKRLQNMDAEASKSMVYAFFALVIFQAGYLQLLPGSAKPWLLPLFILLNYISEQKKDFPRVSMAFRILGFVIGGIEFLNLLVELVQSTNRDASIVAIVTLGLGLFYYLSVGKLTQAREKSYLSLVHVLAVLALYRICYEYGSLAVSVAWALYAAFILGLGYKRQDRNLVTSSLVVLFFASGKALIYDGSGAPTSVRIGSLIFTGILLFGTGVLFRKMQTWPVKED